MGTPMREESSLEIIVRRARDTVPLPRKISLEVPGFAGENRRYEVPQAWQCKPWVDANSIGIELYWGIKTDVVIESKDGTTAIIGGDYARETGSKNTISQFAPGHYGINTSCQLVMPQGWGGLILPHPRWFMDPFHTTLPYITPGLIEFDWWPRLFFVVAQVPPPGVHHVYRYGEPFCQVVPVPVATTLKVRECTAEERARYQEQDRFIGQHYNALSTHVWKAASGKQFGNIYKVLAAEFRKQGRIDWEALRARFPDTPKNVEARPGSGASRDA
jgi:hypothetical protein